MGALENASAASLPADSAHEPELESEVGPARLLEFERACYACKARFRELHHFYDQLCPACARLNWAKRHLSADLRGRVALVTGGRVKIGFQVVLKLLRGGASVAVTSRFPVDAARRIHAAAAAEPGGAGAEWPARCAVYGLDLRDLPTLEAFTDHLGRRYGRLDILVNNATQTIRRLAETRAALSFSLAPFSFIPKLVERVPIRGRRR